MGYAFVITHDSINADTDFPSEVGKIRGTVAVFDDLALNHKDKADRDLFRTHARKHGEHFRLLDDDGVQYLSGYAVLDESSTGFEPLDWAQAIYGCTEIRYKQPDGKYATL